jgi:hypothetical protein
MDLLELGFGSVDWTGLARDGYSWKALLNAVMNLQGSIQCWETTEWLHNLWRLEW